MDFARKQLLKYGWSEGKGLGKNENGISNALKPALKFDKSGVGHDHSEQFTHNWWENMYNQAANNIEVQNDNNQVNLKLKADDSLHITTKKHSHKHFAKHDLEYGSFLKTSKLTADGVVDHDEKISFNYHDESEENCKIKILSDEQLFAACGGRTAHKGARHGLKLNGKLARIEEQEALLLKKMKEGANSMHVESTVSNKYSMPEDSEFNIEKQKHKKKKNKSLQMEIDAEDASTKQKPKKRSHSNSEDSSEDTNYIDIEAACKRTEYFCEKQEKKKKKSLQNKQKKQVDKMSSMLENVSVTINRNNKDDGFEENNNDENEVQCKKKHKKKKRKLNEKTSDDDGFEECINEVNERLIHYKELRKDLEQEKRKGDERIISHMSDAFKCL